MRVFVTGATGYLGRPLTTALLARGHTVTALTRSASQHRVADGCAVAVGNALDGESYHRALVSHDTLVHLVGTPHPSPRKAAEFVRVDLASIREAVAAAQQAGVPHIVYVSVAQPAPVMQAYIAARAEGEALIRACGLNATILRPWYVLGPGHRWPYALVPLYWVLERAGVEGATRLGLVTRRQMVGALVDAVENPASGVRVAGVADIKRSGRRSLRSGA